MMKVWPPPLSPLYSILFINTGGGGGGRRKEDGGWRAGRGCCCCWGSRSCCLIRHGVFIITSCARVFLASFSSSFFSLVVMYWPSKGGQQHTREPSVCVFICIKMDNKKEANKKKRKEKTCCCTISWKRKKREEGIYDPPPPFRLYYLTRERNRDFDLDFFDQLTRRRRTVYFFQRRGFSLSFLYIREFYSPPPSVLLSRRSSLSLFLVFSFLVIGETRSDGRDHLKASTHSSGHLVELLIWQPR